MDTWEMIDAERLELADLCDSLTLEQWDAPSLCSQWRVRDVTAHVVQVATQSGLAFLGTLVRYGFRVNTMIERQAVRRGSSATPEQLCAQVRALVGVRRALPGVKPTGVLSGELIHQQDIRRALHLPRTLDPARVTIALDEVIGTSAGILPGKRRAEGLYLRALDFGWQRGDPNALGVSGSGEAVLMALAGRADGLADLNGQGVDTMRARL
jgi:uncharacterized protein (TIGR03083 family)